MKKTLVSALTTALVVGAASTTFAAANPFSDVPADHWAYDAVAQLAADGVIEGYGDTTFRGDRNITRYEMAQMIARAMAKSGVDDATKAMLDKLAAEFADELNNLGVRVSNLERNADMVKWNGKIEYTYTSTRYKNGNRGTKTNDDHELFRLEPSAEVNDHWHVNARLDAANDMQRDAGHSDGNTNDYNVKLKHIYAQGDYKNFMVQLGKMELADNMGGTNGNLVLDNKFSGALVQFGSKLKAKVFAGRTDGDNQGAGFLANGDTANIQGLELQYDSNKLVAGGSFYHLSSDSFKGYNYLGVRYANNRNNTDSAAIWALNLGYHFDKNSFLHGAYAHNTKADNQDNAWEVGFDYKGAQQEHKGTWGAWIGYRKLGANTALMATTDDLDRGFKGWHIGANYTVLKNIVLTARYSDGDSIDGDVDFKKLFGRVEFFF